MKFSQSTGGFYDPSVHSSIPADAVQITRSEYLVLLDGLSKGLTISISAQGAPELQETPQATLQKLIAQYTSAVQNLLDSTAIQWGYDSISNAVTYAEEPAVPKFQAEGQAFRAWRSACWNLFYTQLDVVTAGTRQLPPLDQLLAELPTLELSRD